MHLLRTGVPDHRAGQVLVQVRPLQTKGCDAYVDREECSAATSQQVEEVRKAKSVRVMNTSLIYIYILRMQSSVQAQGVELGKEVPMQRRFPCR